MNENAQIALKKYREDLKNGVVEKKVTTPIEKLAEKPQSLRLAINAMCYDCMGRTSTSTSDIRGCTAKTCPLFNVRPHQ